MLIGRLIRAAALVAVPHIAAAQFTSFIQPQCKVADSVRAAVVVAQKAKADTAARIRLTNMKEWVDSAAGVPRVPSLENDSVPTRRPNARPPVATPRPAPSPSVGEPIVPNVPATPVPTKPAPNRRPPISPGEVAPPIAAPAGTDSFHDGAPAPATASMLPLVAAAGALTLVAGVCLLATGRPERGRA